DATSGAHVAFAAFGLEQVGRFYEADSSGAPFSRNYRNEITHAALCWMTTFTLSGRVVDNTQGPVAGALVKATLSSTKAIMGTALTRADGTFIIRGLPPAFPAGNNYDISAQAPGFLFQHGANANGHGMKSAAVGTIQMSLAS